MNRLGRCAAGIVGLIAFLAADTPASAETHSQLNPGGLVVAVSPSSVAPGQTLEVTGFRFPAGIDVSGQICGDDDMAGSVDCVLDNTGIGGTASQGRFTMSITVAIPPVPCPCVVVITSPGLTTTPSSPVTIVGAPVAALRGPTSGATVTKPLQILNAQLGGNGPWYSWFGGMAKRTLTLTVRNPNSGVYPHPSLFLAAGKTGSGTLLTVSTSALPSLEPGQTKTFSVNVVFPPFSVGENEVRGAVGDAALTENISVTTTIVPWGLLVIALIILQFIFLAIRNVIRRRNERRQAGEPPLHPDAEGTETPPGGAPAVPSSDELPQEVGAI
jgi:hypothetical protein